MFRELGLPNDPDWTTQGPSWIDQPLRTWMKDGAEPRVAMWEEEQMYSGNAILRTSPDSRFHLAVISLASMLRVRLDRELLVLVGQAEELGITWTAVAEALATSPQNAHKVFGKRLMAVRNWVAEGWGVDHAVEQFYRRKS